MPLRRVLWVALLALACSDDKTGTPDADEGAGDPADAAAVPDAPPTPDAPATPDAGPAGDGYDRPDGGVLVCGSKALYESCEDGIECSTCLCYTTEGKTFCSQSCDGNEDCPGPSPGCSTIFHVCRPPP